MRIYYQKCRRERDRESKKSQEKKEKNYSFHIGARKKKRKKKKTQTTSHPHPPLRQEHHLTQSPDLWILDLLRLQQYTPARVHRRVRVRFPRTGRCGRHADRRWGQIHGGRNGRRGRRGRARQETERAAGCRVGLGRWYTDAGARANVRIELEREGVDISSSLDGTSVLTPPLCHHRPCPFVFRTTPTVSPPSSSCLPSPRLCS